MIKNVQKNDVNVEFSEKELSALVKLPSGEDYNLKLRLLHPIIPEQSTFFFLNIFIDYAITVVPFPPLTPLHPAHSLPLTFPPYSSCPWVILISSLASTFPILFSTSPCLFSTYHLCYLFSVPFPLSHPPTPLLITLHVISISVVLFLF